MGKFGCLWLFDTSPWRITFKAITFVNITCRFMAIHVCSGKIRYSDLQKFTLWTRSENPEVDTRMASLVSEAQVIQWQHNKKSYCIMLLTRWNFAKKSVKITPSSPVARVTIKSTAKVDHSHTGPHEGHWSACHIFEPVHGYTTKSTMMSGHCDATSRQTNGYLPSFGVSLPFICCRTKVCCLMLQTVV